MMNQIRPTETTLEHLHLMIEIAQLGTWDFSPKDEDLNWSALAKRFFGLVEEAPVTYEVFLKGLHPDDKERVHATIQSSLNPSVGSYVIEYRTIGILDGIERHIESRGRVLFNESHVPVRIVGVSRDVTQQRRFEQELSRALSEADAASRAKAEFLAHMSHEIRTPLGAMLGFADLALDEGVSEEERNECLRTVRRNGEQLLGLINDILDLSKIDANKLEIEEHELPILDIIHDVETSLKVFAEKKGIRFTCRSVGLVPKLICTDPLRLKQILLNVVGNAIKFTNQGSVELIVEVAQRLAKYGDRLRLKFTIKDTGIGISPEHQARLFQTFTQADSSMSRKFGGTGLGLALSQKLARALGGDLYLKESQLGVGSTFEFVVADSIYSPDIEMIRIGTYGPVDKPIRGKLDHVPDLSGIKVLLAEDARDNQVLVSRYLGNAGATVEIAQNGQEAIRLAESGDYDVVLMDLQMPVLDGYDATETLREHGFEKPIIALTAHAMKGERERCLRLGFDDHISKPIDRGRLLEEVAEFAKPKNELLS